MISVIFRAKMKPGKEDEAVKQMTGMVQAVKANEPGALVYAFHRPQEDPSELVFFEVYADDDAFKAHTSTAHMGVMRSSFAELFDPTTVKLERLERVAGFARAG
jgi:autoinducer 2-degrading protein